MRHGDDDGTRHKLEPQCDQGIQSKDNDTN